MTGETLKVRSDKRKRREERKEGEGGEEEGIEEGEEREIWKKNTESTESLQGGDIFSLYSCLDSHSFTVPSAQTTSAGLYFESTLQRSYRVCVSMTSQMKICFSFLHCMMMIILKAIF